MALNSHLFSHAEHILHMKGGSFLSKLALFWFHFNLVVDPNKEGKNGKNPLRIAIERGAPEDLIKKMLNR